MSIHTYDYETLDKYGPDQQTLLLRVEFTAWPDGDIEYHSITLGTEGLPITQGTDFEVSHLTPKDITRLASSLVYYVQEHGLEEPEQEPDYWLSDEPEEH